MKKTTLQILAVLTILTTCFSCGKDDDVKLDEKQGSAKVEFLGVSYTKFNADAFGMVNGVIAVAGETYMLTTTGIGEDGTSVNVCNDPACTQMATISFVFEESGEAKTYYALSGTIKRKDKTITINASMSDDGGLTSHPLEATVDVSTIINM